MFIIREKKASGVVERKPQWKTATCRSYDSL